MVCAFSACLLTACASPPKHFSLDQRGVTAVDACDNVYPTSKPVQPLRTDNDALTLLNWNTYKGKHGDFGGDFAGLSATADIVALQEAKATPGFQAFLNESRYSWRMGEAFHIADDAVGVLTAARGDAVDSCAIATAEPWIRIPKQMLVSRYVLNDGQELLVGNVHFVNFSFTTRSYAQQLTALENALATHNGPLILAGDFNTWSDEREALFTATMRHLGLQQVVFSDDKRSRFLGRTVDHVLYRGLDVGEARVFSVDSSDHNPMIVTFNVPKVTL